MNILLALDSYKGCLTSTQVETTLANALATANHNVTSIPMTDGGDGMLHAFTSALGAQTVDVRVHDPLMRLVDAHYAIAPDGTAIIETSQACGLALLAPDERDPLRATTFGVGELIAHARLSGCRRFILGLGGSGTSDAGIGLLRGLLSRLKPDGDFDTLFRERFADCSFILASDVRNPLCGENGAAAVYGPQKGADESMVAKLDLRARRFAEVSARHFGFDKSECEGAGAAGGLGYVFLQYFGASVRSGADLLFELSGFEKMVESADLVITGEGRADRQTLMGKLPERVLKVAQRHSKPVWLLCGSVSDEAEFRAAGFERVCAVTPRDMPISEALKPDVAKACLVEWVREMMG